MAETALTPLFFPRFPSLILALTRDPCVDASCVDACSWIAFIPGILNDEMEFGEATQLHADGTKLGNR